MHVTETCDPPDPTPTGADPTSGDPTGRDRAAGTRAAGTGRGAAEHHRRGGHHGRDRAGRRDDRARSTPRWPGGSCCPREHYLDSGYPSAALVVDSLRRWGVTLVTPLLADQSRQAKQAAGYDRAGFTIDFDTRAGHLPAGPELHLLEPGHPTRHRRHRDQVRGRHLPALPGPRPVHPHHPPPVGRQLTVPPREVHDAQLAARAAQDTPDWQADYARRAGVEGTIRQAVAVTGIRRARYRGLPKTRLEHVYSAVALNLIRLDAYWNGHALDRTRTSHLTRLEHALAA